MNRVTTRILFEWQLAGLWHNYKDLETGRMTGVLTAKGLDFIKFPSVPLLQQMARLRHAALDDGTLWVTHE